MARTPEKLVEVYLQWRTATFPEWGRAHGLNVEGVTTQDPMTRVKRAQEGRELLSQLKEVKRKNRTDGIDLDVRLCIDDGEAACSQLESADIGVRELIDLVAPDPDEKPWVENARWFAAAAEMPKALARAQASGPWIREILENVAIELVVAEESHDPIRRKASRRARLACENLAAAVGYRPLAKQIEKLPKGSWDIAKRLVERDRRRLEIALQNVSPSLLPESALIRVTEEITESGRALGLLEGWENVLREAVEKTGWAPIPPHKKPSYGIMPASRSYSSAGLRHALTENVSVMISLPISNIHFPLTAAHETYPGHMLQKVYQRNASTEAQRLLGSTRSSEGWAHYAEMKINELQIADPRLIEVGLAQRSLTCSVRLLARVGMTSEKLTYESVLNLFKNTALLSPQIAKREADRVQWNHRVIDYALGRLALESMEREFVDRGMGDQVMFRTRALPLMHLPLDIVAKKLGLDRPDSF